ncbi:MAG: UDP-N-acetylmuramoyl-L-alanine--D-glutamate ligase [Peptococcaceae bacterium]|nr:UDP-N-acetylmuramoyl-L-alanine--D-glutamate ligase [Peptococcaceae bacterium]
MELKDKRVLVVGAGKSGMAVARFLTGKGSRVVLTDSREEDQFDGQLGDLRHMGVATALGGYPPVRGNFDLLVISPGVPLNIPPVVEAGEAGIPVIGELELAGRFARAPIIAITGTNGKTTTTTLVGEIFKDAGHRVLVAGNIGLPLVEQVESYGPGDVIVAEVSSFQLETVVHFRPRVGVVLNLTPDHLDRHGDMAGYAAAKSRISMNQRRGDYLVLNYDDSLTREMAGRGEGDVIFFSRRHILERGVFVRQNAVTVSLDGTVKAVLNVGELRIPGAHNLENALAATAACRVMGIPEESIAGTLRRFTGVAHRLEFVAEIDGVRYINDSKGTNPDASIKAVEAFPGPLVLIAGGRNKGNDFTGFTRRAAGKTRAMVVVGECAGEMARSAAEAGIKNILWAGNFREAVLLARSAARPGDVVLLSPACASWDMFKNFEERGDLFKQIVREMASEGS